MRIVVANYEQTLTVRQAQVYINIINYQRENGYSPTVRELCKMVGVSSTSTIVSHLKNLEESGFIRRKECSPRAIEVL